MNMIPYSLLFKLLEILLSIHVQESAHLSLDSETTVEYNISLMFCGKQNTWSF